MAKCLKPYRLKDQQIDVPCNKCPNCTARRISGWSFRLMQQYKIADTAVFLTMTYDTKHVPLSPKGYMTLEKTHPQLFFKRLRKSQCGNSKSPIKYYLCGEYGGQTNRPHYHAIIFNAKLELLQDAWQLGQLHYGMNVNEAAIGYTLKYMAKPSRIPMHANDDRQPEFSLMSKGSASTMLLLTQLPGITNLTNSYTSS